MFSSLRGGTISVVPHADFDGFRRYGNERRQALHEATVVVSGERAIVVPSNDVSSIEITEQSECVEDVGLAIGNMDRREGLCAARLDQLDMTLPS